MLATHAEPQHGAEREQGQGELEEERTPARCREVDSALAQLVIQDGRVEAGGKADGEREPGMAQTHAESEQRIHRLGGEQRDDRNLYRRPDVLPRVETGGKYFYQNDADQADAVTGQCLPRHQHVARGKLAMLEEGCQQRHGDHAERQRGRQREQESQAQAPVQ
ncbi:MAG: hypothetical protein FD134_2328 [Gallionellaceae bacterium]|nr:MAG: hypothetical protein FD134_2328 [Gallionellaceae bacterium]